MSVYWILIIAGVCGFIHALTQSKQNFPKTTNIFDYIFDTKY